MSQGFAIQFKNGQDVMMRIYPDIHIKGGNINLAKAKEPMPNEVTDETSMIANAGELVNKAGVVVRAYTECQKKFTDLLLAETSSIQRSKIVERAKINLNNNTGTSDNSGNNDTESIELEA